MTITDKAITLAALAGIGFAFTADNVAGEIVRGLFFKVIPYWLGF